LCLFYPTIYDKVIFVTTPFLLYGSYGYTGTLIAEQAVKRGMHPILSGRDLMRLKSQADTLGLEYRPISLDDPGALDAALKEVHLVLNCAGPFVHTYKPVVDACLRMSRQYLDITGEILVFEALVSRNNEARRAGVMLLPGVGFDVVPSDCLASHLKQRMPGATHLILAIKMSGGRASRGTILSAIEHLPYQGAIRKDGKLIQVPFLWKNHEIDFGGGPRTAMNIPWGDVSTAYYSTGIPNIETYMVFPESVFRMRRFLRPLIGLTTQPVVQRLLRQSVLKSPAGPSAEARRLSRSRLWGEASDDLGRHFITRMETPDGYDLTVETALAAVERVLAGDYKPGFQTPSLAYGADFILQFAGVRREDLELS
jgi:short subunit dehydrogenase-like uncharacterized protein